MPSFTIYTNLDKGAIPQSFLTEMSSLVSQLVGKPEKVIFLELFVSIFQKFTGR